MPQHLRRTSSAPSKVPNAWLTQEKVVDNGDAEVSALSWWEAIETLPARPGQALPGPLDQELSPVLKEKYKGRAISGPPLFYAIEFCAGGAGTGQTSENNRQQFDTIKHLLDARADHEAWGRHKKGKLQPIHLAAGLGCVPALEALKDAYGDDGEGWRKAVSSDTLDENGKPYYSPLHDAIWFGMQETAKWLLNEKADPNKVNTGGETPMHLVAKQGHSELVRPLVASRADLRIKNKQGENPLLTAVNTQQFPMEKFHLLAASCNDQNPAFNDYLRDIWTVAIENAQASEMLVSILL